MNDPCGEISRESISMIKEALERYLGICCDRTVLRGGLRALRKAAEKSGYSSPEEFLFWLLMEAPEKERVRRLAEFFTVGETYFFRGVRVFLALRDGLIPDILARKRSLGLDQNVRIWSAGCSTGEEPYTLAILLEEAGPRESGWSYSIVATDINGGFIARAKKARYGQWSFRKPLPEKYKKYFTALEGGEFEVIPDIKKRVSFSVLNLVEEGYPSPATGTSRLDVIICRNVIMYMLPEYRRKVVERFRQCLVEGGFLILTPAEVHSVETEGWKYSVIPGGALLQKTSRRPTTAVRASSVSASEKDPVIEISARSGTGLPRGSSQILKQRSKDDDAAAAEISKAGELAGRRKVESQSGTVPDIREVAGKIQGMANDGQYEEALELIDRHAEALKFRPEFYYLKGALFREMGRTEEALASYRRALYLDPHWVPALIALGTLLKAQGNRVAGNNFLREALALLKQKPEGEISLFDGNFDVPDLIGMIEAVLESEKRENGRKGN
ncbi:CheR family methyltransferase [Thermodesulforhabdus norvegica]|uniref:MCP methyltransferase, CheR-type n=1 Tax=Thermodesulforhabdus norvegica TaxID=39841 RepID=A0A1I4UUD8_9BACT|nr:protein-glutamate O-methyltransferase CheR [Thermodesulforhabdus norvegica]SFM92592.1 MCP methyltransferase, CheR-type [Thermodesulforhabdus norvegica]